jgi:hypothetical protein
VAAPLYSEYELTQVLYQTSQLPENDRLSVTLKEYLAEIDVCMGGRVAEELSELTVALPLCGDELVPLNFRSLRP